MCYYAHFCQKWDAMQKNFFFGCGAGRVLTFCANSCTYYSWWYRYPGGAGYVALASWVTTRNHEVETTTRTAKLSFTISHQQAKGIIWVRSTLAKSNMMTPFSVKVKPLLLLLLTVVCVVSSQFTSTHCNETSCEDCVTAGCGWIGFGSTTCLKDCSFIADVACYSEEYFPDKTPTEICEIVAQVEADSAICADPPDCESCTSTVKSDGVSTCEWYEDSESCGRGGCFMLGCGTSDCKGTNTQLTPCQDSSTCEDCLDSDCAWAIGTCLESCDIIADVSCYSKEYFPDNSGAEICEVAKREEEDIILCASQDSCSSCIETVKADGESTCVWYEDTNTCASEVCGLGGCGSSTCNGTVRCEDVSTCEDCLNSDCAWAVGTCLESCSVIADVSCYSQEYFLNNTGAEICEIAKRGEEDSSLCASQESCSSCIQTVKADGESTCVWFEDFNGCSSEVCGLRGCGSSTCDTTALSCDEDASTCEDCLNSDCAWAIGTCLKSCSVIADVSCYSKEYFLNNTGAEICEIAKRDEQDASLCASQESCSSCIETVKADGESTCVWFEDFNGCSSEVCGLRGCGSSTCDTTTLSCDEDASTCEDCLNSDCAWAIGTCLKSCSVIADVSCYSKEYFLNNTGAEICEIAKRDEEDASLCASQDSCSSCIETVKADGESTCVWFEDFNGCSSEVCGLRGCGSSTCNGTMSCEDVSTCEDCLDADCAWAIGTCLESCSVIADVSCYSKEYFLNNTGAEICEIAKREEEDASLCASQDSCSSCIQTVKADGESTCFWFEDFNGCSSEACDLRGCGSSTCNGTVSCEDVFTCDDCLDADCAWAIGTCLESCSVIADVSCYSKEYFLNNTRAEICEIAKRDELDAAICSEPTNCANCTNTVKSNGSSTCEWYELSQRCGVGGCDSEGECGSSTCNDLLQQACVGANCTGSNDSVTSATLPQLASLSVVLISGLLSVIVI